MAASLGRVLFIYRGGFPSCEGLGEVIFGRNSATMAEHQVEGLCFNGRTQSVVMMLKFRFPVV